LINSVLVFRSLPARFGVFLNHDAKVRRFFETAKFLLKYFLEYKKKNYYPLESYTFNWSLNPFGASYKPFGCRQTCMFLSSKGCLLRLKGL